MLCREVLRENPVEDADDARLPAVISESVIADMQVFDGGHASSVGARRISPRYSTIRDVERLQREIANAKAVMTIYAPEDPN